MNWDFNKIASVVLFAVAVSATTMSVCMMFDAEQRMAQYVVSPLPAVTSQSLGPENPIRMTASEVECLATNIYHEARGESLEGKIAVAHVTINRVWHHRYPDTVCGVVYQARYYTNWKGNLMPKRHQCQFSWYCDGKPDHIVLEDRNGNPILPNQRAWRESVEVARGVLAGIYPDNTGGATHYFNPDLANPNWQRVYDYVAMVDSHVFYVSTY